jgi:hypothetical protein
MTEETPTPASIAQKIAAHPIEDYTRARLRVQLVEHLNPGEKVDDGALRILADRVASLEGALAPVREFVRVNDGDTLSRLAKDDTVVACASGSWSRPAPITLGDLRKIVAALGGEGGG